MALTELSPNFQDRITASSRKHHHVAATTSTSSLQSLAVQSMLRTTTELGDVGQFAIRPSRLPRSTSRLPMRKPRSVSSSSSITKPPQHHMHQTNRQSQLSRGPRPATSFSGFSRQDTIGTNLHSYHSSAGKRRYPPGQQWYGPRRLHNSAIDPRGLHTHRSLVTLRGQRDHHSIYSNSPMLHPRQIPRHRLGSSSPAYSEIQSRIYDGNTRFFRPGSIGTVESSPASMFHNRQFVPGHYQDANSSYASLLRLPSPAVSFVNNPYQRGTDPSRYATPASASLHNHQAMSVGSTISMRQLPRSATGSTTPVYYDYTESFVEEDCFSHDVIEDETLPPLNMDRTILEYTDPANRRQARTPFGAIEGSTFYPSELPTVHNRRPSKESKHSPKDASPHGLSSPSVPAPEDRAIELLMEKGSEDMRDKPDGGITDLRRLSVTSRRTTTSSASGVFFPNCNRSPRNLPVLAARIHSPSLELGQASGKALESRQESLLSKLCSEKEQSVGKTPKLQLPLLTFRPLSMVTGNPVIAQRPKTSDDNPSRKSPEIYCPVPERPMSSQSRRRFSKILEIQDDYSSFPGKAGRLLRSRPGERALSGLNIVEELTDSTTSEMRNAEFLTQDTLPDRDKDIIDIDVIYDPDFRSSGVASNDKSTIESLLDKHIECLGLKPETEAWIEGYASSDHQINCLSSTDETIKLTELFASLPNRDQTRPTTSSSCRNPTITIAERQKLKPRRLFASMNARFPSTISEQARKKLSTNSSVIESVTRLSYGWEPLPSSVSLASPPLTNQPSLLSGDFADIDTEEKNPKSRFKYYSDNSLSPVLFSSPSLDELDSNTKIQETVRHRRSKSEVLVRQESHRRRRMRIRLKLRTTSSMLNDLRQHRPCNLEANIEISESPTQEYLLERRSVSIKSPIEGLAELSGDSIASPASHLVRRFDRSPPIPARWSSIVAAMPEPNKRSAELRRKPSILTLQSQRSNASIVEPINSTRLNAQIPRLGDIPYIPPPEFGPPLTCSNLNLSIPYADVPSTIQPTLRETRSFFSDNGSAQRQGMSLRNKFGLHSFRSAAPLVQGTMMPTDAGPDFRTTEIMLSHSCQMKGKKSGEEMAPSEIDSVTPMSDFAYAKRKMMLKMKDWWKRQCMQKMLKTKKRKDGK